MNSNELIWLVAYRADLSPKQARRLLRELALTVANGLAGNETVTLPYLGQMAPLENTSNVERRAREVKFLPGSVIRKGLSRPAPRVRMVK